ncbi:MAG: hypothetical protein M3456_06680 [Actinomycetota bacterium]|nr:hypothetical protein [Actinomycetota bacterium]
MTVGTWLAGPILRRADQARVCIWLATAEPASVEADIFAFEAAGAAGAVDASDSGLKKVGSGGAETAQLGPRLYIHLIKVMPETASFPADELLAYDVAIQTGGGAPRRLRDLGLVGGANSVAYGDLPLPTFFIRSETPTLHVLHGSCRLLHGKGEDSLVAADEIIARYARDPLERPSSLFLTGDQIYADEVAGPLTAHVRELGTELLGEGDPTSVPGVPNLSGIPIYGRQETASEVAKFTSDKAANHLMSFGEFAAMNLVAWNEANWPKQWPAVSEAVTGENGGRLVTLRTRRKYRSEIEDLERARTALPKVRRVLANVPTYMICDDHDVTDDWNLTARWQEQVRDSVAGRRIVSNAIATFWAFQAWGNDPDAFDDSFKSTVTGFMTGDKSVDDASFDSAMWSFDRWSYCVPTEPPTIVLDTRSQRTFDSPEGAARLVGGGMERVVELSRQCGYRPGHPLVLVSAVPAFGLELQERRQKFLVDKLGPYEIDFEAWHSNLAGMIEFMHLLIERLGVRQCVVLSGDVHYGLNSRATFSIGDNTLDICQLVSSSQKHSGELSKIALNLLGRLVSKNHERVGWKCPPERSNSNGLKGRVLAKSANTDDWSDDGPVFLAPSRVRQLGIETPPDYRETRNYVPTTGPQSSMIVGENNIGLVSIRGDEVTHRLLSRSKNQTCEHRAKMRLRG